MKTDLNTNLENYLKETETINITAESIKKYFKDINVENEYGGLLQAVVHNLYPEEKVLKFIKEALKAGINVNLKGERTGYSFIHLALYGYTKDDEDYSYSTEFIVKIIELAKKYGLDVQIKDNDSDSIVHTAIASEVYTGSTIDIINALGKDYDLSCKDCLNNNIYEALLQYKKEAKNDSNEKWYKRLEKEEQEIQRLVETSQYSLEEIEQEIKKIHKQIEGLVGNTNLNYLNNNYQSILEMPKKIALYTEKKNLITQKEDDSSSKVWEEYLRLVNKSITIEIEKAAKNPSFEIIDKILTLVQAFKFNDLEEKIQEIRNNYINRINILKENINTASTLSALESISKEVAVIADEDIVKSLQELIKSRNIEFRKLIEVIEKLKTNLEFTNTWLSKESKGYKKQELSKIDYSTIELNTLNSLREELVILIEKNKKLINGIIVKKCSALLNSVNELGNTDIFNREELLETVMNTINNETPKQKVKVNRKNKNNG